MNYEKSIIQINVQKIDIDLNHPLNVYSNYASSGSGFFIENNLILTCYHVINSALNIIVTLIHNDTKIEKNATIKYIFPDDDLAVIEIDTNNIEKYILNYFLILNKNISLDANTIGFPLNSKNIIINKGIISGFPNSLIQTDSTLNSGNSGGPLIINNKVVGISQSKLVGNASNIGFAIPIFRFLILWELKKNDLKLVNKKPKLYFEYQQIKQKEKHLLKTNGVIITFIHKNSILNNTEIEVGDYLLEVCNHKIDNDGLIQFSFYPEKIELKEIHYWFTENDDFMISYYSNKKKKIIKEKTQFKNIKVNLINYYPLLSSQYYWDKNGLVISIFTDYHSEKFNDLEFSTKQRIQILNRYINLSDIFTVYLADVNYSKSQFKHYPVGDIIIEINNTRFDDYDSFITLINKPLINIKTINNEVFYI